MDINLKIQLQNLKEQSEKITYEINNILENIKDSTKIEYEKKIIKYKEFKIDTEKHMAYKNENYINFNNFEYIIFTTLLMNRGKIYSFKDIYKKLYGDIEIKQGKNHRGSIATHMARIRRKIGDSKESELYIISINKVGYYFK